MIKNIHSILETITLKRGRTENFFEDLKVQRHNPLHPKEDYEGYHRVRYSRNNKYSIFFKVGEGNEGRYRVVILDNDALAKRGSIEEVLQVDGIVFGAKTFGNSATALANYEAAIEELDRN